jgi:REP element-mobilizing transposase RayT
MPRKARLDVPGALHHIIVRGINKAAIFNDDHDKTRFLERLSGNIIQGECKVYAWVLMTNHIHLLFKSGKDGISAVMRKQLTWYAQYYNKRHKRTGHLFENRYKSILCDEETYLLALIRYIHLNPIRAKIINTMEELDRYPWTGHRAIIGKADHAWMDIETVLSEFGSRRKKAVIEYRRFVREGIAEGRNPTLTGGGLVRSQGGWSQVLGMRGRGRKEEYDERILGSGDFVHAIVKEAEDRQLRQIKHKRSGKTIQKIIDEECKDRQINHLELKAGGKRSSVSTARANIAYRCREELGVSAAEIARYLGVNTSCIVRAIDRVVKGQEGVRR